MSDPGQSNYLCSRGKWACALMRHTADTTNFSRWRSWDISDRILSEPRKA